MSTSVFLSLELIYLVNWLIKHEHENLQKLVKKSLNNGLKQELENLHSHRNKIEVDQKLYNTFMDFLAFLENGLIEGTGKRDKHQHIRDELIKTLKSMNLRDMDMAIMHEALKEVKNDLTQSEDIVKHEISQGELKNRLVRKLCKNWHPKKSEIQH